MTLQLIPTNPIEEANKDLLRIGNCVKSVSSIILQTNLKESCSFGIYNDWGKGKTSFLKLLKEALKEDTKIKCLFYQASRYGEDKFPLIPLINALKDELGSDGTYKKIHAHLEKILACFEFQLNLGVVQAKLEPKNGLDQEFKQKSEGKNTQSQYYQLWKLIDDLKGLAKDTKIVLLIDDLDRCQPDIAINLLEGVKHIFDCPHFFVVMGLNKKILNGFVKQRLTKLGIKKPSLERYFEKLFKVEFTLDDISKPDTDNLVDHHFKKHISKEAMAVSSNDKTFEKWRNSCIELIKIASRNNPRAVIKLLNSLILHINLDSDTSIDDIQLEDLKLRFFNSCLLYAAPAVYEELNKSRISKDVCRMLMSKYDPDNSKSYLIDFFSHFASPNELDIVHDLLKHRLGKKWLKQSPLSSETDQTILLKENNISAALIQQLLLELVETYLASDNSTGKNNEKFDKSHPIEQLEQILRCLIRLKEIDNKVMLCIDLTRRIIVHCTGSEDYLERSVSYVMPKNNNWLRLYKLCAIMTAQLSELATNPSHSVESILLYAKFTEVLSTTVCPSRLPAGTPEHTSKNRSIQSADRILKKLLETGHIDCFATFDEFAAKVMKETETSINEKNLRFYFNSQFNPKGRDEYRKRISQLYLYLEVRFLKYIRNELSTQLLIQLVLTLCSLSIIIIRSPNKAKYYLSILKEIKRKNPLLASLYSPQIRQLETKTKRLDPFTATGIPPKEKEIEVD